MSNPFLLPDLGEGLTEAEIVEWLVEEGAEILERRNTGTAVSALGWNAKGTLLAFGTEDGDAGILEM